MSHSSRQALGIRVVSLAVTVAIVLIVPPAYLFIVAIALGQGHFMLAYLYQREAGKLDNQRIIYLIAAGFLLLWIAAVVPFLIASFFTAAAFLFHFSFDEARLLNRKHSLFTTLEAAPFILLYASLYGDAIFGTHMFYGAIILSLVIIGIYAFLSYKKHRGFNETSYAFAGWALVTLIAYAIYRIAAPTDTLVWFWGLVILHYSIWYGVYWYKLREKPAALNLFLVRAVALNILLGLLAFIWVEGGLPVLFLLFSPFLLNIWTWLHGIASLRFDELKASTRLT